MLRWLGPRKAQDPPDGCPADPTDASGEVTDDPLAAIDPSRKGQKIYSVSRSVLLLLPRVALKNEDVGAESSGGGVNPLFEERLGSSTLKRPKNPQVQQRVSRQSYPPSGEKSSSSGYGGSHGEGSSHEPTYADKIRLRDDVVSVLEQNSNYVKSIQVATTAGKNKSVPSLGSGSSGAGTLTTIPEGKVDFGIPRPIWPKFNESVGELRRQGNSFDSLVDEALLLYTSVNYVPNNEPSDNSDRDVSIRELLVDLSNSISATMDGKNGVSPEQMLKCLKEKISMSLDIIRNSTEEEMRKLCVNLSNRKKLTSVVRAFSNSSSSGNSSQSSPELNSARIRTISAEAEEIYQLPSGSSSSGFSDSVKHYGTSKRLPPPEDPTLNPNGMRNAIIYGTLCRANVKTCSANEKLLDKENKSPEKAEPKKSLLQASNDSKPSVWQQYYGVNLAQEGEVKYLAKPTDVPLYPGGRPEADFTLDVPRSELLSKKMKEDKKWRCRCRLLTSFLGLVFFLLSVMAVSLMLTRGRRMFGSMV